MKNNNIIDVLFDYQRFSNNGKLQEIINGVVNEYSSDDESAVKNDIDSTSEKEDVVNGRTKS